MMISYLTGFALTSLVAQICNILICSFFATMYKLSEVKIVESDIKFIFFY